MGKEDLQKEKICCIINPYAANKRWERNLLFRRYLQRRLPGEIIDTQKDKEYTIHTAKKMCADHDIIVAAGGDGTIADVIQGIIDSERNDRVKLGVLPLGSGNAFCESLRIPKMIGRAIDLIQNGDVKEMDLIDVGGKVASFGSVGATAQILVEKLKHNIPGFLGHILAARIMLKMAMQEQEVELIDCKDDDGNRYERQILKLKVFDIVFGKTNHFGYRWKVAPMARIDDGYIDVTFFEITAWKYMLFFPGIYFGTFQKTQRHYKAKEILIRGKNLPVQYNGELLGLMDEVRLKILPKALKIIYRDRTKWELFSWYKK